MRESHNSYSLRGKLSALIETILAFALMHVAFRAFKRFTSLGQLEIQHDLNLSPAVAMIVVALGFIAMRRGSRKEFGITLTPLPRSMNAGLVAFGVFLAIAAVAMAVGLRRDPTWTHPNTAIVIATLNLLFAAALAWTLRRIDPALDRGPQWFGLAIVASMLFSPMVIRGAMGLDLVHTMLSVLSFVVCAAVGEELFFRGYVQSRLNESFRRRWTIFGIRFGPGLIIASVLFGLIHTLNPYDYFTHSGRLNWIWGMTTASAVAYGLLREKTGSVVTPMILHGFVNLAGRLPAMLSDSG